MLLDTWKTLPDDQRTSPDVKLHKGYAVDEVKIIDAERRIRFVISTSDVDRDRDTVDVNGWELGDYRRNPVVQWAHSYYEPPIARAIEIGVQDGKLKSLAEFPEQDVYPFGDTVYRMLKAGYLNATSVGFRPIEWAINEERRGVDFKRQMLLEYSVVPIPSNAQALVEARSHGTLTEDDARLYLGWAEEVLDTWHGEKGLWLPKARVEEAFTALSTKTTVDIGQHLPQEPDEQKFVPRDVSTETADEGTAWNRPTLAAFTDESWDSLSATQRRRIAGHFAYSMNNPPEAYGDLKLPHHRADDGYVVWRGVRAAMGALLGARGGVDIPDGERRAVYNHLVRHYRAFEKEPPEFRYVEAQILRHLADEYVLTDDGYVVRTPVASEASDEDALLTFVSSLGLEDHHNPAPLDVADLDADTLRSMILEEAGATLSATLRKEMTAITGRLYDG